MGCYVGPANSYECHVSFEWKRPEVVPIHSDKSLVIVLDYSRPNGLDG